MNDTLRRSHRFAVVRMNFPEKSVTAPSAKESPMKAVTLANSMGARVSSTTVPRISPEVRMGHEMANSEQQIIEGSLIAGWI